MARGDYKCNHLIDSDRGSEGPQSGDYILDIVFFCISSPFGIDVKQVSVYLIFFFLYYLKVSLHFLILFIGSIDSTNF